jgi:membrane protease YdiL (CAAX protease family)
MEKELVSGVSRLQRLILFLGFVGGGLLIFLLGGNTFRLFPTNKNPAYEWGLTLAFLALALIFRRSAAVGKYWKVAYALFVASFANALNLYLGNWLADFLPAASNDAKFLAVDKLSQAIPIVASIILLTLLAGDDLGSIFLKKGNLRFGLTFGLISFGVFTALFVFIAVLQASGPASQGLWASGFELARLWAALPWMLVFCFTNSIMEELWFRGIFLGKLTPLLGAAVSIIATALVFGLTHMAATYISATQAILFAVIVVTLGVVNGWVMLKTDSIWGSVLFHAGYDLLVIIPVLAAA